MRVNISMSSVVWATLFAYVALFSQSCDATNWYNKLKSFLRNPEEITKNAGVTGTDYKLFKTIMSIREIVDTEIPKAKRYKTSISKGSFEPNPYYNQTKEGFFIRGGELYTKFGTMDMYRSLSCSNLGFHRFQNNLFKNPNLNVGFCRVWDDSLKHKLFLPGKEQNGKSDSLSNVIPVAHLNNKLKGKKDVVVCCDVVGSEVLYDVNKVNGEKLPKPTFQNHGNYRSPENVRNAWEAMEKRFKKEDLFATIATYLNPFGGNNKNDFCDF